MRLFYAENVVPSKLLLVLLLGGLARLGLVHADFGDYVDPTFNCPATTTCQQVCVASAADCPASMTCGSDNNVTLCADGSCAVACDESLLSPCLFDCASVACPKVIDTLDNCEALYGLLYAQEAVCGEEEWAVTARLYQYNEFGYVFCYCWVTVVTFLILAWCFVNNKMLPVTGSTQQLDAAMEQDKGTTSSALCVLTGYKHHPIGLTLHILTISTFAGWNALLAWLTIQYYVLDENPHVSQRKLKFDDEEQLLKTFIITWSVAFAWCFLMLKWPHNIWSVFLRRSTLDKAGYVAVFQSAPQAEDDAAAISSGKGVAIIKMVLAYVAGAVNGFMQLLFSDSNAYHRKDGVFKYCKILTDERGTRYFYFSFRRYNFEPAYNAFLPGFFSVGSTLGEIAAAGKQGLTTSEVTDRFSIVGNNSIEMEPPLFEREVLMEFAKPFYTYQLFMVWTWFPLYYYFMAMVWLFVITTSGVTVAFFRYRNLSNLFRITNMEGEVEVLRDGSFAGFDQKELVPGDVVKLSPGTTYCDMALVAGKTTLGDESALTGESAPQVKQPINAVGDENSRYDRNLHRRHTISAGTTILESDEGLAVVMRTGSFTTKGELVREIFSFRRHQFKFDHEVPIVLAILVLYAVFGFNIVVYFIEDSPVYGWFYGMFVVATVLPPLLPSVFTVSVGVSDDRLARKRIATVNSESILIAGKVTRALFDKTGTLTKQGLDYMYARSALGWNDNLVHLSQDLSLAMATVSQDLSMAMATVSQDLSLAMATCHNLTKTKAGEIVGNSIDATMFRASEAVSIDKVADLTVVTDSTGNKHTIVRQFDFDHHSMTQGVIVERSDGTHIAIVKGSGEALKKICTPTSLPNGFDQVVRQTSAAGMYQISVACKPIEADSVSNAGRDEIETDLSFAGTINFRNVMREETPDVIQQLAEGEVQSVMVTGDNVNTGVRIAQESGIMKANVDVVIGTMDDSGNVEWTLADGSPSKLPTIDQLESDTVQLAMSGAAFEKLVEQRPGEATRLAQYARVFGRCTPREKVLVVDTFVKLGYVTLMCGDGSNDCGALKAAHVGVALSDSEASVVAPFTALDKNISSVLDVLKEGRCALFSALSTYKFIIMYGQVETINQIINAYFQISFTVWCWIFMDGVWTITLGFTLPLAGAASKLARTRPTASILGPWTMASVLGVLGINFIFTIIALSLLWHQDWFQCRKWDSTDVSNVMVIGDNYESEVLFLVTGYQYIASAIVFNFGYEFRQAWFSNYAFVGLAAGYTIVQFYITMVPGRLSCLWRVNCVNEDTIQGVTGNPLPIQNPFNTTVMPKDFRVKILLLMIFNLVAICCYDYFVVNGIRKRIANKKRERRTAGGLAAGPETKVEDHSERDDKVS